MSAKSKKRAAARNEKLRRKHERYKAADGKRRKSRYARKKFGELTPQYRDVQVWCGRCYRHHLYHDLRACLVGHAYGARVAELEEAA